jgi:hypothetical protein
MLCHNCPMFVLGFTDSNVSLTVQWPFKAISSNANVSHLYVLIHVIFALCISVAVMQLSVVTSADFLNFAINRSTYAVTHRSVPSEQYLSMSIMRCSPHAICARDFLSVSTDTALLLVDVVESTHDV